MREHKTYVIKAGDFFLANAATSRMTEEYPDAEKFDTFHKALAAFRKVVGYKCRIIQNYGLENEMTVWK